MYGLNDNFLGLIRELYDFTRCERSDGTAYGTGGTCRKGVEAEKKETSAVRLSPQQEAVRGQITKEMADVFGLDRRKTAEFYKEVGEEKRKILKEMDENRQLCQGPSRKGQLHDG
jgi:hypothetical protein